MKLKFNSPEHLWVFLTFLVMACICLYGTFYNPFHLLSAGMCGVMCIGTYKGW